MVSVKKGQHGYWISYLRNRISLKKSKNFVGFIQGETGSGKTYSGLSICEMGDPNFNIDQVVFSIKDLIKLIKYGKPDGTKLKRGSFVLFEEVGIEGDAHQWMSVQNRVIKYLLETFRHKGFILFMTAPFIVHLAKGSRTLLHGVFDTTSIDYEKKVCYLKPFLLQYNARWDKTYWKYLRVKSGHRYAPIKRWGIPHPSQELARLYEERKAQFSYELYERMENELEQLDKKNKPKFPAMCEKCNYEWHCSRKNPPKCPKCGSRYTKMGEIPKK